VDHAAAFLVTLVFAAAASAQQESPSESKAQRTTATWLFRTDLECHWSIDGEAKGLLRLDDRVRVTLELGEHLIEAVPASGGPRWEQVITVKEPKAQVFTIPLLASQNVQRRSQERAELEKERAAERAEIEKRRSAERAETEKRGYWVDPGTRLMWAAQANGGVDWYEGTKYCRKLRVGGYRDWRLPMIEELERIRDPGPPAAPKGGIVAYELVWSSTQGQTRREARTFDFWSGQIDPKALDYNGVLEGAIATNASPQHISGSFITSALCVRP
jgi:hypothetical protein